ncbi:hypothetical protein [Nannocystis radixulma]|uniref:Uncharacterized protein n=1 Tax=Nannocystis radixulma TaxID=2995305 RepID=A0ABT5AWK9_9BACT|nr:hypothetical protein [Nannocystis radixulma]MDC0666206.1 hypothetical protein [Nannocystis radixulma]
MAAIALGMGAACGDSGASSGGASATGSTGTNSTDASTSGASTSGASTSGASTTTPTSGDSGTMSATDATTTTGISGSSGGETTAGSSSSEGGSSSSTGGPLDEPVDHVIEMMPPNSWKALPDTNMADVCPEPYHSYFCNSVMIAWSGAAYDHGRDRMLLWGGGHADSYYNNIFAFDLGAMQWSRLTEMPPGTPGNAAPAAFNDMRPESCGYYPSVEMLTIADEDLKGNYIDPDKCHNADILAQLDLQQPRSSHSYGKPVYMPTVDAFFYLGGGYYPSAQTSSQWGFRYSFASGLWSESAPRPGEAGRGMTAVDAAGDVWNVTDSGGPVMRYRPSDDAWDAYGTLNYDVRGVGDIDRVRNQFWLLQDMGQQPLVRGFDLDDDAKLMSADPYIDIETSGDLPPQGSRVGFVYADGMDMFVAWTGGHDVYFLDPETRVWTRHTAGGDEPTVPAKNGTYGRWRYSTARKVFVLVNDTLSSVYIYKP